MTTFFRFTALLLLLSLLPDAAFSQMITGVWKGRINRQKVEIKLVQKGDSLLGTAYYAESGTRYRRYSIKGYFDPSTNQAVWWDDQLLEEKPARSTAQVPLLSSADFNCPGSNKMLLDGKAAEYGSGKSRGEVSLQKTGNPDFEDDWDYIIDNYTMGGNDPALIDSIARQQHYALAPAPSKPAPVISRPEPVAIIPASIPTLEEKYTSRQKIMVTEIPLLGDSIEFRFYDNAEIDGDSISLFLNGRLIHSHIRLTGSAYKVRLAVADLQESNELTMVAENLGTIPPNTSYMVAESGSQRYEAKLESTEGSSATIRLYKPVKKDGPPPTN